MNREQNPANLKIPEGKLYKVTIISLVLCGGVVALSAARTASTLSCLPLGLPLLNLPVIDSRSDCILSQHCNISLANLEFHDVPTSRSAHKSGAHHLVIFVKGAHITWILIVHHIVCYTTYATDTNTQVSEEYSTTPAASISNVCPEPPNIVNGVIVPRGNTTVHRYSDLADVRCQPWYTASIPGNMVACRGDLTWDKVTCDPTCKIPPSPIHGSVQVTATDQDLVATFTCMSGYLLSGNPNITCLATGVWKEPAPLCFSEEESFCQRDTDYRSYEWHQTKEGYDQIRMCPDGFEDGEMSVLSTALYSLSFALNGTVVRTNATLSKQFLMSVSNMLDSSNEHSWRSLQEKKSSSADNVLLAVENLGKHLSQNVEELEEEHLTAYVMVENIAMEVKRISGGDTLFPAFNSTGYKWIEHYDNVIHSTSLSKKGNSQIVSTVIYRNLTHVLPRLSDHMSTGTSKELNGPVVAFTVYPSINTTDFKVNITFKHFHDNYSGPACNFWKFSESDREVGSWSSKGCHVVSSSPRQTICACNHTTNFAVLMSPFAELADQAGDTDVKGKASKNYQDFIELKMMQVSRLMFIYNTNAVIFRRQKAIASVWKTPSES
ncbi:AGRB3-like protein [Mya arenaria]|uniref:AGRB3-like protein n=1 Tax=Mya arenaria TaxID=6604 RepID=A0ABY7EE03_MYAAR|nr:AGRB3-like protein [Mya arenaria]